MSGSNSNRLESFEASGSKKKKKKKKSKVHNAKAQIKNPSFPLLLIIRMSILFVEKRSASKSRRICRRNSNPLIPGHSVRIKYKYKSGSRIYMHELEIISISITAIQSKWKGTVHTHLLYIQHTNIHTHIFCCDFAIYFNSITHPQCNKTCISEQRFVFIHGRSVGKNLQRYFNAKMWDVKLYVSRCLNFNFPKMIIKCELVHSNRDTCTSFSRSRFR